MNYNMHLVYSGDNSPWDLADFKVKSKDQTFEKAVEYHLKEINLRILRNGLSNLSYHDATKRVYKRLAGKGWIFDKAMSYYLYDLVRAHIDYIKLDHSINRELAHYMNLDSVKENQKR